jgi:hypothetical protein
LRRTDKPDKVSLAGAMRDQMDNLHFDVRPLILRGEKPI